MTAKAPRPPAGLGAAGLALWRAVLPKYVLEPLELVTLVQAARLSDLVAALDAAVLADGPIVAGSKGQPVAHPAISAASAARRELARLIRDLDLPDDDDGGEPRSLRDRSQQQRAADTRWAAQRRLRGGHGPAR